MLKREGETVGMCVRVRKRITEAGSTSKEFGWLMSVGALGTGIRDWNFPVGKSVQCLINLMHMLSWAADKV